MAEVAFSICLSSHFFFARTNPQDQNILPRDPSGVVKVLTTVESPCPYDLMSCSSCSWEQLLTHMQLPHPHWIWGVVEDSAHVSRTAISGKIIASAGARPVRPVFGRIAGSCDSSATRVYRPAAVPSGIAPQNSAVLKMHQSHLRFSTQALYCLSCKPDTMLICSAASMKFHPVSIYRITPLAGQDDLRFPAAALMDTTVCVSSLNLSEDLYP